MAVFNDLDFLWPTTDFNIFKITAESLKMSPKEFYNIWINDEKLTRRPFCCEYTQKMWNSDIKK
jgi:hypothetical protein